MAKAILHSTLPEDVWIAELTRSHPEAECTLTELAAEVDRAKSTVSETFHRAEGKVVREFVEGLADPETRSWS